MSNPAFHSGSPAVVVSGHTYSRSNVAASTYVQLTPAVDVIYGPTRILPNDANANQDFYVYQGPTAPDDDDNAKSAYFSGTAGTYTTGYQFYGTDPLWVAAIPTKTILNIVAHMAIDSATAPAQPS